MKDEMHVDDNLQEVYTSQLESPKETKQQKLSQNSKGKVKSFVNNHKKWTIVCGCICIALIVTIVLCSCFVSVEVGEAQAKKLVLKAIENSMQCSDCTITMTTHTNDFTNAYDATVKIGFKKGGDHYEVSKYEESDGDYTEGIVYYSSSEGILYQKSKTYTQLTGENKEDVKSTKLTAEEIDEQPDSPSHYIESFISMIPGLNYFSKAYRRGGVTTYVIDEKDEADYSNVKIVEVSVANSKINKIVYTAFSNDSIQNTTINIKYKYKKYNLNKSEFGSSINEAARIEFGTYPQSLVKDGSVNSSLNSIYGANPGSTWTNYGYYASGTQSVHMYYRDVIYNGTKYRGVYFTDYRPAYFTEMSTMAYSKQDENAYGTLNIYWFKYEPIKWRVIKSTSGSYLLLADLILDSQEFSRSTSTAQYSHMNGVGYANNYALSDVRNWLINTFYNTAFSLDDKDKILTRTVENTATTSGMDSEQYSSTSTSDSIFLLSYEQLTNCLTADSISASGTEYAKAQGLEVYTNGQSDWWLRSAYNTAITVRYVSYDGYISNGLLYKSSVGIRPACWIAK